MLPYQKSQRLLFAEEKYTIVETRSAYPPPGPQLETSFKHYVDGSENGPEIINVTGVATGATILPPDQVLDVTRRSSMAAVTSNKPSQV